MSKAKKVKEVPGKQFKAVNKLAKELDDVQGFNVEVLPKSE